MSLRISLLAILCLAPLAPGQAPGQRQYYGPWAKHTTKNYYYRYYYFKKSPADAAYTYHYGIYYPSRGKHVYMYNPHTRKYWGRWEGSKYSQLPQDKQKGSIDDIPADDFPPPGAAPNIPEIDEKIPMLPPPTDFPKRDDDRP